MRGNKPMFWLKLHISVNISVNSWWNYHKPLQTMTRTTTNDDMNHHKSQITTNHHKPWDKPPWTMTETSTKHDMNHYKSQQTMTWTIMMTQKELCIKPYGFLVKSLTDKFVGVSDYQSECLGVTTFCVKWDTLADFKRNQIFWRRNLKVGSYN